MCIEFYAWVRHLPPSATVPSRVACVGHNIWYSGAAKPGNNRINVPNFNSDPAAMHAFGDGIGGSRAPKRIKYYVTLIAGDGQNSFKQLLWQSISFSELS